MCGLPLKCHNIDIWFAIIFQLKDLLFFIAILVVVILAYGVASQALRYPNSEPSWSLLLNIFYLPYWQMYGELFLEDVEGKSNKW